MMNLYVGHHALAGSQFLKFLLFDAWLLLAVDLMDRFAEFLHSLCLVFLLCLELMLRTTFELKGGCCCGTHVLRFY
jgi:hypothetical protein